jgi:hypothetical protein
MSLNSNRCCLTGKARHNRVRGVVTEVRLHGLMTLRDCTDAGVCVYQVIRVCTGVFKLRLFGVRRTDDLLLP